MVFDSILALTEGYLNASKYATYVAEPRYKAQCKANYTPQPYIAGQTVYNYINHNVR